MVNLRSTRSIPVDRVRILQKDLLSFNELDEWGGIPVPPQLADFTRFPVSTLG